MKDAGRTRWPGRLIVTMALAFACLTAASGNPSSPASPTTDTGTMTRYNALPLAFEVNAGQADPAARFVAHGPGYTLALGPDAFTLMIGGGRAAMMGQAAGARDQSAVLRLAFAGANPAPAITAADALPGVVNYLIGNDPSRWCTNVPTSGRVRYTDLYPGIDLTVYGAGSGGVEYDAIIAPGADPAAFALAITGAAATGIDARTGDLVIVTARGDVRQHVPVAYQERSGTRAPVDIRYDPRRDGTVGFTVGAYDATLPLVIDPQIVPAYGTYLGGSGDDYGYGIAVDTSGNAYVAGQTASTNFPVTNGSTNGGGTDAFVTKLNANGARVYSTYLGGNGADVASGIAVDSSGNAYVTGQTASTNFPVTNGSTLSGGTDAFVTKLNASGTRVYSTYLGGSGDEQGYGIAVDTSGNAYVTGYTTSTNFPVTNGSTNSGFQDVFVTKLNPSAVRVYSTYLGGGGSDFGNGIAVDSTGNAYITGYTASTNFPVTDGSTFGGDIDAFVTKLNASGARVYSTYLGGSGTDVGASIAVDTSGNAWVTGNTGSTNFPVTNGSTNSGLSDAFVTKLNASGVRVFSTYLGGSGDDFGFGIALDTSGNAYITGSTYSTDFPVTNGSTSSGSFDAFVAKFNTSGARVYSTYLGGGSDDYGRSIGIDTSGNVYITGYTGSTNFPVTDGSTFGGGSYDAFVVKLALAAPPAPQPTPHTPGAIKPGIPNVTPRLHTAAATTVATPRPQPPRH